MAESHLIRELSGIVGSRGVLSNPDDLMLYEYDGLSVERLPDAVVFPTETDQVAALVNLAREKGLPIVARGAGTGLSGGAVAAQGVLWIAQDRTCPEVSRLPGDAPRSVPHWVRGFEEI